MRAQPRGGLRVAVAAIAIAAAGATITGAGPDLFDEIYQRGQAVDASWQTLTARFVETSTSTLLSVPLVARGTLAVARPARIVLHYTDPDRRTVLIDEGHMTMSWPARGVRSSTDISASQRRVARYFVDKSPNELRKFFTIAARVADDRPGTWAVTLVPLRKQMQEGISEIDLWIDRTHPQLTAMLLHFPNGDLKRMEFDDVRLNPALDAATFSTPP
jgi:outer membrane lipoprotein-sorting protein